MVETAIPHADWGAPHCRGTLKGIARGDQAQMVCGECEHIVCTVAADDLQAIITRMRNTRVTTIPHQDFGDPDCCGCLDCTIRGDETDIICNECGTLIRTIPTGELDPVLDEMELSLDMCTEMCPHCGKVNVISGFSEVMVYTCRECRKAVTRSAGY